jgi:hypothetical protein
VPLMMEGRTKVISHKTLDALDYCWVAPTLTPYTMQVHCHKMSGRLPLYLAFVLRKVLQNLMTYMLLTEESHYTASLVTKHFFLQRGQPPTQRRASNANRGKMFLTEGDMEYLET